MKNIANESGQYQEIEISTGAYLDGKQYSKGATFVKAKSYKSGKEIEVFAEKKRMTEEEQNKALYCLKYAKLREISESNQEALKNALEYPQGSGATFSISEQYFQEYNALLIRANALPFPYIYSQGSNHVGFEKPADIVAFDAAAQRAYFIVTNTRYQPAINKIKAVTIESAGSYDNAIDQLLAVEY